MNKRAGDSSHSVRAALGYLYRCQSYMDMTYMLGYVLHTTIHTHIYIYRYIHMHAYVHTGVHELQRYRDILGMTRGFMFKILYGVSCFVEAGRVPTQLASYLTYLKTPM